MARVEVRSPTSGTVWMVVASAGATVGEADAIVILESMKMEIPVEAGVPGTISSIVVEQGTVVASGDVIAVLDA